MGAAAIIGPWLWRRITAPISRKDPLPGYITDAARLEQEYQQFTGKPLQDAGSLQRFQQATTFMLEGNYANAAIVLEDTAKAIAVPAVFNDIGVVYLKLNDSPRALRAFRDALARDHDYQPVRASLKRMNLSAAIDPGLSELEPNNNSSEANAIWMDHPVDAQISPSVGDVDCFWFITPRPPRDRISVAVTNKSTTLIPHLRILDADGKLIGGVREASAPSESVRFDFSSPPNALYHIQVDGASGTSGAYVLSVSALRAYDIYEPNDDILNATHITPGQSIQANIMDASDTDFYSFVSPVAGSVNVDVTSRDGTLVPGLSTFAPDLHSTGFGPDVDKPGAPLQYVMKVEANQTYYLQIWGKNDSTGAYSLTVK